jgi:hypothetical protein
MEKIFKILILLLFFSFIFTDTSQIKDNDIIYSIDKNDDTWTLNFKNKNYFGEGEIIMFVYPRLYVKSKILNKEIFFLLNLDITSRNKFKSFQNGTKIRFKANLREFDIKKLTIEGTLLRVF